MKCAAKQKLVIDENLIAGHFICARKSFRGILHVCGQTLDESMMLGFNILVFILLTIGHTTLWIAVVNRTHGCAWPRSRLQCLRHFHDLMLPLFPIVLIGGLGVWGPRLLRGGSWNEVTPFWWSIIAVCCCGLAWLIFSIIRGRFEKQPPSLVITHSEQHNIADELGRSLVGHGKYRFLTHIPGNEQFQVESNEKILRLDRLPTGWEGLRILHLSDWHFTGTISKDYFTRVTQLAAGQPVDLIVFSGDLIDEMSLLNWLPETLGRLEAPLGKYFILGNHDWYRDAAAIREALSALGWQDLGSRGIRLPCRNGFLGLAGDETPWMGRHPAFPEGIDFKILVSHSPDNIRWAQSHGVDLMLSGHTHGGQVRLPLIGPVYSPSRFGCRFASGLFWESPTLLHVSRGLSGEHPLRWRCLPEISRLVLVKNDG
jgi:predicted MPP superfamily phosphohydrolase